jgi:hypothetical protein
VARPSIAEESLTRAEIDRDGRGLLVAHPQDDSQTVVTEIDILVEHQEPYRPVSHRRHRRPGQSGRCGEVIIIQQDRW